MTPTNQRAVEELDYTPGKLDETAPPRIWLQVDTSANNDERDEPFPADLDGVTWQDEQIGGLEVEYVRADLATRTPGWRPISEAPKSSEVVLFCDEDGNRWTQCAHSWEIPVCGKPAKYWQPLPPPPGEG
jgi:hypothetical protein